MAFTEFSKFGSFNFNTFKSLQKWSIKTPKVKKLDDSKPLTFEYVMNGNDSIDKALKEDRKISIKTPYSVRWLDDNTLNEQLPYNLSTTDTDLIHPKEIASTCIDSWDYDPKTLDLDVYFTSSPTKAYTFPNVPKSVVLRWINAPSKGQFYWRVIRRYSIAK